MKKLLILAFFTLLAYSYTYDYTGMKCEHKYKCSQMKSCKEAYFYLEVCRVKKLDRDNDGIPCEKLCK